MTTPSPGEARPRPPATAQTTLLLIATIAVALNLRPALAALGPVLDLIERDDGLSSTGAALLTTLPVLLMGVGALLARPLRAMAGERGGIALGALLVALACAARFAGPTAPWRAPCLIASAVVAGLGIAAIQALMPGFLKRVFGAGTGRAMALYTTGIMAGAALAAAGAADLSRSLGWPAMLGLWSLPALGAGLLWTIATRAQSTAPTAARPADEPLWRSGRAWLLLVFFGIGTGAYTLVLAWLPPFYIGLGQSRDTAGYLLAGLTLMQVAAGLSVSAVIGRFPDRRGPLAVALLAILAGLACLVAAPLVLAFPAAVLLGLGIGALFPLSLIVTLDHVDDPIRAGNLTAFVQGGGYIVASAMPFLAGWLRDHTADLSQAWTAMAAGIVVQLAMAARLSPRGIARTASSAGAE